MKIVMTLLVRDEEDIIATMIEYHLKRGVAFFIATDNMSEDGTADILRGYEQRGVLHYIRETGDDYSQSRWVTRMARLACTEFQADWVINSDADEFWWPERGNLATVLGDIECNAEAVTVQRTNFVPITCGEFFAHSMTYRERQSTNFFGNPLPAKVCHRAFADISIAQGNHEVYRNGRALPAQNAPITILHFPIRTYRQFANKIAKGGAAYARNTELPLETGATWRELYGLWQSGQLADYYRSSVFDHEAIGKGLANGSLLFDDRLKHFLQESAPV